jgi:hypothetical protein
MSADQQQQQNANVLPPLSTFTVAPNESRTHALLQDVSLKDVITTGCIMLFAPFLVSYFVVACDSVCSTPVIQSRNLAMVSRSLISHVTKPSSWGLQRVISEPKLTKYTLQYECSVVEPASDLLTGKLSLQQFWDDKVTKPSLYGYQVCFLFKCCSLRTHQ